MRIVVVAALLICIRATTNTESKRDAAREEAYDGGTVGSVATNYTNPTLNHVDAPDPGVLRWNDAFVVANTGGDGKGNLFPMRQSYDLTNWTTDPINYIFSKSTTPLWSSPGSPWAPEIHATGFEDGGVRAYFVSKHKETNLLSIGAARAETRNGTLPPHQWVFRDTGKPLVHNVSGNMGSIDPTHYYDAKSNTHWLLYKNDGNAVGEATFIYAAKLSPDGMRVVSSAVPLFANDPSMWWEGGCIEAPWVLRNPKTGALFIFYSGPGYCFKCGYSVSVARSKSGDMQGPWEKDSNNPLMTQNQTHFESPGHCSVVEGRNGGMAMVYHSYVKGNESQGRFLMLDELTFDDSDGWPRMKYTTNCPSESAMPVP